jgi:hypothetical protein
MNADDIRRRLGMEPNAEPAYLPWLPANTLWCLSLQLAVEAGLPWQDTQWATRIEVDDDGVARVYPLFVNDVPAWVEAVWEAPLPSAFFFSVTP